MLGALAALLLVACGSSGERPSPGNTAGEDLAGDTLMSVVEDSATSELQTASWQPDGEAELRGRAVRLNPLLFSQPDTLREGRHLRLNLFEDVTFTGRIVRTNRTFGNVRSIAGEIAGQEGAWFTMSVDQDELLAQIYLAQPPRHFVISYSDAYQQHMVVERDPEKEDVLPGHPPVVPPDSTQN